ncbi:MAG: galactose mutarotase [Kiritimatiellae bacterium]|nr:galactose mutarotase [Kiritimatiellia bacterium]
MKPTVDVREFGTTKYGETAHLFAIHGAGGVVMEVSDYGGKIVRLFTPDKDGNMKDVVVGFDSPAGWDNGDPYWGCIIGRYGNRIAAGRFSLGGVDYRLPALNNAPGGIGCNLHGGARGWNAYVWKAEPFVRGDDAGVVFTHVSPDGDEGFPGKVEIEVTYTLTKDNVWRVDYKAVPDKDTPINMTQHVYFNFKGESGGTIEDHVMTIAADRYLPTDAGQIPTGELRDVSGTPFDFRAGMRIGEKINAPDPDLEIGKGYDHCWVLNRSEPFKSDSRYEELKFAARLACPLNGRVVEVWTTEPCVQVYTANWASYDQKAKGGEHLSFRCGVALETQHAPDSPNKPEWPTTIVPAGATYRSATEFRFSAERMV